MQLARHGKIKVVDTRSAAERSGRRILESVPIQFGPDAWSAGVAEQDRNLFLAKLIAAGFTPDDAIVTVCNAGLRALESAKFLRSVGVTKVNSVAGGYVGRDSDPGWQFLSVRKRLAGYGASEKAGVCFGVDAVSKGYPTWALLKESMKS